MNKAWIFSGLVAASLALGTSARADSISFTLDQINIPGYTGPFASVDVNRTSTTEATITFTGLSNGGTNYLLIDGGIAAVQVNGTFTTSCCTFTQAGTNFN